MAQFWSEQKKSPKQQQQQETVLMMKNIQPQKFTPLISF
jgi:hypothetical protein